MNFPEDLKYTNDHEWIRVEGSNAHVGITDFAQSELGEIVFVELNAEGETLAKGECFGTIEAVKTVSELYMPVTGRVIAVNSELESNPELVNEDPYEKGSLIIIEVLKPEELGELMSAEQYKATL